MDLFQKKEKEKREKNPKERPLKKTAQRHTRQLLAQYNQPTPPQTYKRRQTKQRMKTKKRPPPQNGNRVAESIQQPTNFPLNTIRDIDNQTKPKT